MILFNKHISRQAHVTNKLGRFGTGFPLAPVLLFEFYLTINHGTTSHSSPLGVRLLNDLLFSIGDWGGWNVENSVLIVCCAARKALRRKSVPVHTSVWMEPNSRLNRNARGIWIWIHKLCFDWNLQCSFYVLLVIWISQMTKRIRLPDAKVAKLCTFEGQTPASGPNR